MDDRLRVAEERYDELSRLLADPATEKSSSEIQAYAREISHLEDMVLKYREYKKVIEEIQEAKYLLKGADADFRAMVEEEIEALADRRDCLQRELRVMLLPRDPNDDKNVVMEIRAGTGGNEAGLFASDLYRMYVRYAERSGWRTEVMTANMTDIGGIKEIVFVVEGKGAYSRLKYESGVHRVQRIPVTESSGRIHTSAATVAVLPEAEEVDVDIDPEDLRIDTYCSSGPGGQSVNTTYSAIRITHLPTGLVVTCQDEKSQHKNRDKAMRVLRARLLHMAEEAQHQEQAEARRSQVGTGDRSERIRTYNFPQARVTDHRIGLTLHRLDSVLDGDILAIIDALMAADESARLQMAEGKA
ncbi:MAG: peptide chain release factor 1 [Bacillota bacterium]